MDKTPNKYLVLLIYVALALTTLAAFWQVRHNGFISFDDPRYILDNSHVKGGLTREGIVWAFTRVHANNWHPLTWISHMLDCELFGLNPFWHHLSSLSFHIANTLLLFWVLKRMTGAVWQSAFVAAVFALHPLHVESVAWVSERKDLLSILFWILTMWAYAYYVKRPAVRRYLLILSLFALGLMTKQMLVTLPFVLLLLDFWPLRRIEFKQWGFRNSMRGSVSARRCILEKVPLLVLSAAAAVIVYLIQQRTGLVRTLIHYPLSHRVENAIITYIAYIGKILWPTGLSIFYPHPHGDSPVWQLGGAILLLMCITVTVSWKIQRHPYLVIGWLWYLGTLVPVIGLVQVGSQAMADRYTYLPSIGIFIMVAWGAAELAAKWHLKKIELASFAGIVLAALLLLTRTQVTHWQNDLALFEHSLAVTENNWLIHNNYGKALTQEGRFDEAVKHLKEALRIEPNYFSAHNNLGMTFFRQEKFDEAVVCFKRALQLGPDQSVAYLNLGLAYARQGKYDLAIQNYNEALRLKPDDPDAHLYIGLAMVQRGRYDEAIEPFKKAVKASPDWPEAYNNLAWVLATIEDEELRRAAEAVHLAELACELTDYKRPEMLDTLAVAYAAAGRFEQAIETAEKAIELAASTDRKDLAAEIQDRLRLYQAGQPYRQKQP